MRLKIIAMKKKTIWDLHRTDVEDFHHQPKMPIAVVVDNVRSLNNIGSIFRTCDAFAIAKIYLCGISAVPPSNEIHKTALGAEDSVDWEYFEATLDAVNALKTQSYNICVLEQVFDSVQLQDFDARDGEKYALVIGHEVDGVQQAVVDVADCCIEIPQFGTKHSLNVSVSTGIALWQLISGIIKDK